MKKENLLIVCYENMDINYVVKQNKDSYNIYLASYDITLIELYKIDEYVVDSFFLEQNIALFDISDEVLNILKVINRDIEKYFDKDLFFSTHIEGGFTSQAIQDVVLFIKSLDEIMKQYNIQKIIDMYNKEFYQQSRFIQNYSIEHNLNYSRLNFTVKDRFHLLKIKKYFYEPYRFYQFTKFNFFNSKKLLIENKSIVISLFTDKTKFLNLIKTFASIIETKTQYDIVYLTQKVDKNGSQVLHIKDKIIELEHIISLFDYLKSFVKLFKDILKYRKVKNKLESKYINEYGYLYSKVIIEALNTNIYINSAYNYRYNKAIKKFIDANHQNILAIKLWGGVGLYEGQTTANYIKKKYDYIYTFDFHIGIDLKAFPYRPKDISNLDFVFVDSDFEKDSILVNVDDSKIIMIESFKQNSIISEFMIKFNRKDSMLIMNIDNKYKYYILIDIQVYIPGYINFQEIIDFIYVAKKLAATYNEFCFLIKPHPAFKHRKFIEEQMSKIKNVQIFDKTDSILHLLNIADVIVTKFSTIGFEAILFEKIVISIIYGDKRWKNFGEGAIYINSFDELNSIFDNFEDIQNEKKKDIMTFKEKLTLSKKSITLDKFIKELDKNV